MANNPALTLGLAMALGMLAQAIARRIHIPGIVILLAAGLLFGPDGLNWIQPDSLGSALHIIVGFAVAVILFEGGMNLRISRIKREQLAIQGLILLHQCQLLGIRQDNHGITFFCAFGAF